MDINFEGEEVSEELKALLDENYGDLSDSEDNNLESLLPKELLGQDYKYCIWQKHPARNTICYFCWKNGRWRLIYCIPRKNQS